MNIETIKSAGKCVVLVNGETFDTIERTGKRWEVLGDSTVSATSLSKALDSVIWDAICSEHRAVSHLSARASHFRNTMQNDYMADIFNMRHFAKAHQVFDTIRPGVK